MPAAIPLRRDFDAPTVRRLARRYHDNRQIRRLPALAAVYDGLIRTEAARIGGMDRQTLRDRVLRFNADGPDGRCRTAPVVGNDAVAPDQGVQGGREVPDGPGCWERLPHANMLRKR